MFYLAIAALHIIFFFCRWKIYKANTFIQWAESKEDCCEILSDRVEILEDKISGYLHLETAIQILIVLFWTLTFTH